MKKLNRVIGGGAVAIAIMLVANAMESGMARASQENILRTKEMVVCNSKMPDMQVMVTNDMNSLMTE